MRLPESFKARFRGARGLRAAALSWLVLLLVVPLAVLVRDAFRGGWENFWNALTLPAALAALRLTLWTSLLVTAVNAVMGLVTAYTLERFAFPGKRVVNALIDLPLAVPGLVTGVVLGGLYGPQAGQSAGGALFSPAGVVLTLLFVCLPLGVRSVQPLLITAGRDQEEAARALGATAWTAFRRVTLPRLLPGILAGALLTFARSLGEFSAVVWVAGNVPLRTQTAAVYILGEIESDNRLGASAMTVVLVLSSFLFAFLVETWRTRRAERAR